MVRKNSLTSSSHPAVHRHRVLALIQENPLLVFFGACQQETFRDNDLSGKICRWSELYGMIET